jgi:hypothetical protein
MKGRRDGAAAPACPEGVGREGRRVAREGEERHRRRAAARVRAEAGAPVLVPRAHAADAVKLAKQVIADPNTSREQKRAAATAAYHAARKNPKVLEANVIPARGAERIVGQTLLDLSDAAIHSPGGAYAAGRAVAHDVGQAAHGHPDFKHSRAIAAAMAKGTLEDVRTRCATRGSPPSTRSRRSPPVRARPHVSVLSARLARGRARRRGEGVGQGAGARDAHVPARRPRGGDAEQQERACPRAAEGARADRQQDRERGAAGEGRRQAPDPAQPGRHRC